MSAVVVFVVMLSGFVSSGGGGSDGEDVVVYTSLLKGGRDQVSCTHVVDELVVVLHVSTL